MLEINERPSQNKKIVQLKHFDDIYGPLEFVHKATNMTFILETEGGTLKEKSIYEEEQRKKNERKKRKKLEQKYLTAEEIAILNQEFGEEYGDLGQAMSLEEAFKIAEARSLETATEKGYSLEEVIRITEEITGRKWYKTAEEYMNAIALQEFKNIRAARKEETRFEKWKQATWPFKPSHGGKNGKREDPSNISPDPRTILGEPNPERSNDENSQRITDENPQRTTGYNSRRTTDKNSHRVTFEDEKAHGECECEVTEDKIRATRSVITGARNLIRTFSDVKPWDNFKEDWHQLEDLANELCKMTHLPRNTKNLAWQIKHSTTRIRELIEKLIDLTHTGQHRKKPVPQELTKTTDTKQNNAMSQNSDYNTQSSDGNNQNSNSDAATNNSNSDKVLTTPSGTDESANSSDLFRHFCRMQIALPGDARETNRLETRRQVMKVVEEQMDNGLRIRYKENATRTKHRGKIGTELGNALVDLEFLNNARNYEVRFARWIKKATEEEDQNARRGKVNKADDEEISEELETYIKALNDLNTASRGLFGKLNEAAKKRNDKEREERNDAMHDDEQERSTGLNRGG